MKLHWPRRFCAALASLVVVMALAGCAQSASTAKTPDSGRIQAASPPHDYAVIGSVAGTNIGTNFESGELPLSLQFGVHFVAYASDAKPAHPATTGAGTSVRDPIRFDPPAGAETELDTALGWLAGRFPDRSDLKAWLLRAPDSGGARTYLLYVQFKSQGEDNAVYLDVTRWAEANRKIGS